MTTAYDFGFTAIDGSPLPLKRFEGQAMLVVNVASRCSFTPQYAGMQRLHDEYAPRGFTVLGVPCNQFMWQEPEGEAEIAAFCRVNYAVTFPMTGKTNVKGAKAHPFYKWMRQSLGRAAHPAWNFHKLLVAGDGAAFAAFPSRIEPDNSQLRGAIDRALSLQG